MKNVILIMLVGACLVFGCGRPARAQSKQSAPRGRAAATPQPRRQKAPEPADIYKTLRESILTTKPDVMGVEVPKSESEPYGILMEMGLPAGLAIIVSMNTGDASLYTGTGGGILGGGGYEGVNRAARALVSESGRHRRRMAATKEFPYAEVGRVRFYVLTRGGVYTAEAGSDEMTDVRHPLHALFRAGNEVITQLRLNTEKKQK